MTLSSQPVSSLARRMFWPPRPMACDSFSSVTAMSMECESSSTTIDSTSAGAIALMTNCAGVVVVRNDVDALAGDLVRHRLHARAAHADAGADRIDAAVVALHRDLGAHARVARRAEDLDQALADFRHFELEQLDQELGAVRDRNSCGPRGSERTSLRNALMRSCGAPARAESSRSRGTKPSALPPRST